MNISGQKWVGAKDDQAQIKKGFKRVQKQSKKAKQESTGMKRGGGKRLQKNKYKETIKQKSVPQQRGE